MRIHRPVSPLDIPYKTFKQSKAELLEQSIAASEQISRRLENSRPDVSSYDSFMQNLTQKADAKTRLVGSVFCIDKSTGAYRVRRPGTQYSSGLEDQTTIWKGSSSNHVFKERDVTTFAGQRTAASSVERKLYGIPSSTVAASSSASPGIGVLESPIDFLSQSTKSGYSGIVSSANIRAKTPDSRMYERITRENRESGLPVSKSEMIMPGLHIVSKSEMRDISRSRMKPKTDWGGVPNNSSVYSDLVAARSRPFANTTSSASLSLGVSKLVADAEAVKEEYDGYEGTSGAMGKSLSQLKFSEQRVKKPVFAGETDLPRELQRVKTYDPLEVEKKLYETGMPAAATTKPSIVSTIAPPPPLIDVEKLLSMETFEKPPAIPNLNRSEGFITWHNSQSPMLFAGKSRRTSMPPPIPSPPSASKMKASMSEQINNTSILKTPEKRGSFPSNIIARENHLHRTSNRQMSQSRAVNNLLLTPPTPPLIPREGHPDRDLQKICSNLPGYSSNRR